MRKFMQVALGAFLLAAVTGVLLRFSLFQGAQPWAQNLGAVRHAHSHLMYFGWATLAIMAMIWRLLPQWTQGPLPRLVGLQMSATALLALLSFPAFWSNGYGLTQLGPVALPLGSMVAGANGLTWIFFAILYLRATAQLTVRPLPVQLWDWAILLLILAFGGALGLVVMLASGQDNLFLQQAMLHLFLELFATGWFTLALLGLLWAWIGQHRQLPSWLPTQSLALLLAPTFILGITPALVPGHIFWICAAANLGAALLLAWHQCALWQQRAALPAFAKFGLLALSAHLAMAIAILWPGLWQWSAGTQLRIFYLHNLLLGWISSSLLGLAVALWFPIAHPWHHLLRRAWVGGVGCMLLALLALGLLPVLPIAPAAVWFQLAAWSSVMIAGSIGAIALCATIQRVDAGEEAPEQHAMAKRLLSEQF